LKASQLEARLAQAQLQALKMQLQPHFLFNTLHAISALVHKDVEAADRMLARLSDLLRLALESAGVQEVPLKQELEFLERYLEIEQTRFQDRLTVRMEIAPEALDALVPNLIMQPLVENAIRHGIAPRATPGKIEITAMLADGQLHFHIRDDGPGIPGGWPILFWESSMGRKEKKRWQLRVIKNPLRFALIIRSPKRSSRGWKRANKAPGYFAGCRKSRKTTKAEPLASSSQSSCTFQE
jgi:LytS/YehU family sensor histidine kinase